MLRTRRHRRQTRRINLDNAQLGEFGMLDQVTHACIATPGINIDFAHRTGIVTKFGENGVETENRA
jgi:hypothetical protein